MKYILILMLWSTVAYAVEPHPPRTLSFDTENITVIKIHHELTTILQFPEKVSMVVGKGLTDGSTPGKVQYSSPKGSKIVVLRLLDLKSTSFMQVLCDDRMVLFKLVGSDAPDSVVHLLKSEKAKQIEAADLSRFKIDLWQERVMQLVKLARTRDDLEASLPDQYKGVSSRKVAFLHTAKDVETMVTEVHRFSKEDTLVIFGTIKNIGKNAIKLNPSQMRIRVGESRVYKPNKLGLLKYIIAADQSIAFEAVMIGNTKGRKLHLSAENTFKLIP